MAPLPMGNAAITKVITSLLSLALFRSQGTGLFRGWMQNARVMQKSHVMNRNGWRGRSCPKAAMSALCSLMTDDRSLLTDDSLQTRPYFTGLLRPRTGSYGIFRNTFFHAAHPNRSNPVKLGQTNECFPEEQNRLASQAHPRPSQPSPRHRLVNSNQGESR
jgi:hypothetical protein